MAMSASPEPRRAPLELLPAPADYHGRSPLPSKAAKNEAAEDDDQFRTPTTEESRLNSAPTTCPPPPAKMKRAAGCKRKLSELEFFKVEADEIERLFRPRDLQSSVRRRRGNVCLEERETSSSLSSA